MRGDSHFFPVPHMAIAKSPSSNRRWILGILSVSKTPIFKAGRAGGVRESGFSLAASMRLRQKSIGQRPLKKTASFQVRSASISSNVL